MRHEVSTVRLRHAFRGASVEPTAFTWWVSLLGGGIAPQYRPSAPKTKASKK